MAAKPTQTRVIVIRRPLWRLGLAARLVRYLLIALAITVPTASVMLLTGNVGSDRARAACAHMRHCGGKVKQRDERAK